MDNIASTLLLKAMSFSLYIYHPKFSIGVYYLAGGTQAPSHAQEHGHTHDVMEHPGKFTERDEPLLRQDWKQVALE